jgi:3,4-dihydroxy 2-butanone 4-phosphate synthase/GTP cyclohydrolase II
MRDDSRFCTVPEAIAELQAGRFIVLVDDEDRENEGDLVCPAESMTPEKVNFMLHFGRGTLCVPLTRARCDRLNLPPQTAVNNTKYGTAFTVTIDAAPQFGVTTGVSAKDRATTILRTIAEEAVPEDFIRPGHVNPLIARDGGVLVRAGQTEGSVDLCRLSGFMPAAALIEILNDDGTMARVPQLAEFCARHGLKMCTVASLIEYRMQRERIVERVVSVPIKNRYGDWRLVAFESCADRETHLALCRGISGADDEKPVAAEITEPVLVRVHSQCLTGDVFGSHRCDCGEQLDLAMRRIAEAGSGVIVYLRQEGRGIGLTNKLHAYRLQDEGLDTVEANERLGFPADKRDYGIGVQILRDLGVRRARILTNNPKKLSRLEIFGVEVVEQLPLKIAANPDNRRYLQTKREKMGHLLDES